MAFQTRQKQKQPIARIAFFIDGSEYLALKNGVVLEMSPLDTYPHTICTPKINPASREPCRQSGMCHISAMPTSAVEKEFRTNVKEQLNAGGPTALIAVRGVG